MLTLKGLVAKCLQKDKAAWSEFTLRFQPLVEKAVGLRLGLHNFFHTREDIKDITQGVFLDIWEKNKLELVREEDKITGWLAVVSQNAAIDFIRCQAKFKFKQQFLLNDAGILREAMAHIASESNPLEEVIQNDFSGAIERLIGSLEPKKRLILRLNLQHNKTHREIAELMKISINTVSSILRRTMLDFRESLRRQGYGEL